MAAGAMSLYTPMIYSLIKNKNADGYSPQTWAFNLLGLTACIAYPFRKGFPISTYIENVALWAQSIVILTLISSYQKSLLKLAGGAAVYALATALLFLAPFPPKFLGTIQILSTVFCNYALLPQIYMNWKRKSAKWSAFSALLSAGGNFIRVFTTLQLTQDKLILGGHMLGFIMNSILLMQIYFYGSK